jgi:hydrogenase maturation factor HypE
MGKFKRKIDIVDAFIWTGGPDQIEDPEWIVEAIKKHKVSVGHGYLQTVSDGLIFGRVAKPGDYVVLNSKGKIYTTSRARFEAAYEPIKETVNTDSLISFENMPVTYLDATTPSPEVLEARNKQIERWYSD